MGRSVSVPRNAIHVVYQHIAPENRFYCSDCGHTFNDPSTTNEIEDPGRCPECEGTDFRENDDDEFASENIDYLRNQLKEAFDSVEKDNGWLGNEDHIIASNGFAKFGVSEYCGVVAIWCAENDDCESVGLRDKWIASIGPKFEKAVSGVFGEDLTRMKNMFLKLFLVFVLLIGGISADAQTMVAGGPNVYSPHLQYIVGRLKLYFGGWNDVGQVNDKIYRSDCVTPDNCTLEQSVKFQQDDGSFTDRPSGFDLVNDPTIVNMGSYLIMYYTVCPVASVCVTQGSGNSVYYSVSWATDGIYWSKPTLLTTDAWLPSAALRPDGNVWLYANNGHDGALFYMNLGPSGAGASARNAVNTDNFINYVNVEVRYNPLMNVYQMVGERNSAGIIDYLQSYDGVNFIGTIYALAAPVGPWIYVRTPAFLPGSNEWLYAAATMQSDGMGNKTFAKKIF